MGTTAPTPAKRYMSLREAVNDGYGSYSTLRAWVHQGKLPASRIGGRVKLLRSDLENLVQPITPSVPESSLSLTQEEPDPSPDPQAVDRLVDAVRSWSPSQRARLRSALDLAGV